MRAILMYHSIDSSGSPVSLDADAFRSHVRFLSSGALTVVPLADLPARPESEDAVAITFDDGFESFASAALPLLQHHALPSTLFVVSDRVGMDNDWLGRPARGIPTLPLMTWDQVAQASEAGVEIGAHTRRHPDLTLLDEAQLADEAVGCADVIASRLGSRPASFAYPYGKVDARVAGAVRAAYGRACTTELRVVADGDDRALLPRLDAWYFREPGQLEAWGTPTFRRRLWLRAQGRRVRQAVTAAVGGGT